MLATADAHGRFLLNTLRADSTYYLFAEAPEHAGVLLSEVRETAAAPDRARPRVDRARPGDSVDPADVHEGETTLGYDQYFKIGQSLVATGRQARIRAHDGQGDFVTGPLYAWPVVFQTGTHDTKVELKDFARPDLVIDFAEGAAPK